MAREALGSNTLNLIQNPQILDSEMMFCLRFVGDRYWLGVLGSRVGVSVYAMVLRVGGFKAHSVEDLKTVPMQLYHSLVVYPKTLFEL